MNKSIIYEEIVEQILYKRPLKDFRTKQSAIRLVKEIIKYYNDRTQEQLFRDRSL